MYKRQFSYPPITFAVVSESGKTSHLGVMVRGLQCPQNAPRSRNFKIFTFSRGYCGQTVRHGASVVALFCTSMGPLVIPPTLALSSVVSSLKSACYDFSTFSAVMPRSLPVHKCPLDCRQSPHRFTAQIATDDHQFTSDSKEGDLTTVVARDPCTTVTLMDGRHLVAPGNGVT